MKKIFNSFKVQKKNIYKVLIVAMLLQLTLVSIVMAAETKETINELLVNVKVTGTPNTWLYNPRTFKWYSIGNEGFAIKGWHQDKNGKWYFFDMKDASMCTGHQVLNGKEYYFATEDAFGKLKGDMYVNEMTPSGLYANENGELGEH